MGIKIVGSGYYLPEKIVSNYEFENLVDTSNEWIFKRTGIKNRHVSCGEYVVQMAVKACNKALKNSKITAEELDLIIGSTVTADFAFPSMSNLVQGKLKAKNAFAIDISCACSGFVYALDMAQRYINSSKNIEKVLIVCSENMTKLVDFADRTTCVLFGDGAAAVVVQKCENEAFSVLKTDGTAAGLIYSNLKTPSNCFTTEFNIQQNHESFVENFFNNYDANNKFLHMEGGKVYKIAIKSMVEVLTKVCEKANLKINDLNYIIPHQANRRIIEKVAQKLQLSPQQVYINIENIGNISSACIPVCVAQLFEQKKLHSGDKVGFVSFGSGLIYGAIIITI